MSEWAMKKRQQKMMGTLKWKLQIIHALLFLQTSNFIMLHITSDSEISSPPSTILENDI